MARSRSAVSATSAGRFAARKRARRVEGLRPLVALVTVALAAGLAAWVGYSSPLLNVRTVEVSGVRAVSRAQVLDTAAVPLHRPLLRLDLSAVRARVETIRRVASVRVVRRWPHTVRIEVRERAAAAVVPNGAQYLLVDPAGVSFATVARRPAGVPVILADRPASAVSLRAAIEVLATLPAGLTRRIRSVRARSPDAIVLGLPGGVTVIWGSAERSPRKAEVLVALMRQRAKVYDVSAPDAPTIRS